METYQGKKKKNTGQLHKRWDQLRWIVENRSGPGPSQTVGAEELRRVTPFFFVLTVAPLEKLAVPFGGQKKKKGVERKKAQSVVKKLPPCAGGKYPAPENNPAQRGEENCKGGPAR